ncbi:hypothetical protein M2262_001728 [Pseudomonas sp. BIGb0408]|uniref:Uncharacterized protein n=1 Tax=Phytopseudomonas flavescens TaxID=29435 RepID=A0A7Y9XLU1_9GAMM|nr:MULTISPECIES: hypothetical protein [Pseudomonas]MCW2291678.1 hypothetical protein [Pseudomonas sp. BIGb0408]NYH73751.1 hypothetical protein [Pseudomonas flavescens]
MSILTGLALQAVFNAAMTTQLVFQRPASPVLHVVHTKYSRFAFVSAARAS